MAIVKKPDEKIFASQAKINEVSEFPDIPRGWGISFDESEGIPPMEWFNGLFKRIDEHVQYILQRGIPEWSSTQTYPLSAVVQYQGSYYQAVAENTGKAPINFPAYWEKWVMGQSSDFSAFMLSTAMHLGALNEEIREFTRRFDRIEQEIIRINKQLEENL